MIRALFRTGRHHIRTAPRPDGVLVTQSTVAARIRHEARMAAMLGIGQYVVSITPDVTGFSNETRRALIGMFDQPEHFAPEQLGALSV